jgi:Rps23 Pro-64 3,4-dihydroxylase Tpa1-like proline 4-hydroxylase
MDTLDFVFDAATLAKLSDSCGESYRKAEPFAHTVIEDFLPRAVAQDVLDAFPAPEASLWRRYSDGNQKKLASEREPEFPRVIRHVIAQLNSSLFVGFLEQLSGIDGLNPDPHLRGGGLHQIEPGGMLEVHADFNWYPRLKLHRRMNLLLYLNQDWQEQYGGHLGLWDPEVSRCERRMLPLFNRCVIFNTTDTAYHGHPHPLACPPGRTRKSLALYYYSSQRPESELNPPHSTLFGRRPASGRGRRWLERLGLRR